MSMPTVFMRRPFLDPRDLAHPARRVLIPDQRTTSTSPQGPDHRTRTEREGRTLAPTDDAPHSLGPASPLAVARSVIDSDADVYQPRSAATAAIRSPPGSAKSGRRAA